MNDNVIIAPSSFSPIIKNTENILIRTLDVNLLAELEVILGGTLEVTGN